MVGSRLLLATTVLVLAGPALASHPEFLYCTEPAPVQAGDFYVYHYQWHQYHSAEIWMESNGQEGLQRFDCPQNRGTDTLVGGTGGP